MDEESAGEGGGFRPGSSWQIEMGSPKGEGKDAIRGDSGERGAGITG